MFIILETVNLAKNGDTLAFQSLIEEHKVYLYNIAYAILNNSDDAGDAICETIFKSFNSLNSLKNPEYFKTWITRILVNECRKILKQKKKVVSLEDYMNSPQIAYTDCQLNTKLDLQKALSALDKKQYDVIVLFYYNDLSIEEISDILDIPTGTVKSRLHTAKKNLYEILNKEGGYKNG